MHLDDFLRPDTKFLDDLIAADAAVLHLVEHTDLIVDELHQILVGRDDRDLRARRDRLARIGRDNVVGLEAGNLDGVQIERLACFLNQRELRHQFFRRGRTLGFVIGINIVAKRFAGGIENDRDMIGFGVAQ